MNVQIVTLTADALEQLLGRAARLGAQEALAHVLPPYSQHALPPGVSRRTFLEACRVGCPHRRQGRVRFVERAEWESWQGRTAVNRGPVTVDVAKHPPPSNDDIDIDALVDKSRRKPCRGKQRARSTGTAITG